jgi:translation initiation factor 1
METINIHIEKKGRGGKTVTVLEGFTHDRSHLERLASHLKRSCGTGGTLKEKTIEIQGDFRPRIREILLKEGFQIKE